MLPIVHSTRGNTGKEDRQIQTSRDQTVLLSTSKTDFWTSDIKETLKS